MDLDAPPRLLRFAKTKKHAERSKTFLRESGRMDGMATLCAFDAYLRDAIRLRYANPEIRNDARYTVDRSNFSPAVDWCQLADEGPSRRIIPKGRRRSVPDDEDRAADLGTRDGAWWRTRRREMRQAIALTSPLAERS